MADPAQSNRAQRSETHEATDDATTSPANRTTPESPGTGGAPGTSTPRTGSAPSNFERGAADRDIELTKEPPDLTPRDPYPGQIGGGPGAGDASSGGGAGAGVPGGGTDMRTGGAFSGGNVDEDRRRIFGDAAARGDAGVGAGGPKGDLEGAKIESDDADFGGPLKIRTTDDNRAPNPKRNDQ